MRSVKYYYESSRVKIREFLNPYLGPIRQRLADATPTGENASFTIISNNCWAGHVYRYFNLPYNSPTIGLYFFSDDYIKFIYNIRDYCTKNLEFIDYKQSKYSAILSQRGGNNITCPIAKLGDIEIVFLHYKTEDEVIKKWHRRCERINWNKIYYKMTEQNLCTVEHLKLFDELPSNNKFVFVSHDYGLESQVIFKKMLNKKEVSNDTVYFRRYINLISFIKGLPFKK